MTKEFLKALNVLQREAEQYGYWEGDRSADAMNEARARLIALHEAEAKRAWEGCADLGHRAEQAEQERDRLRAMAREIEQIILPDPYDERETDRGWMRDRIRAAIDAALTAEGQRGET